MQFSPLYMLPKIYRNEWGLGPHFAILLFHSDQFEKFSALWDLVVWPKIVRLASQKILGSNTDLWFCIAYPGAEWLDYRSIWFSRSGSSQKRSVYIFKCPCYWSLIRIQYKLKQLEERVWDWELQVLFGLIFKLSLLK